MSGQLTLNAALPEIFLALAAMLVLMVGVFSPKGAYERANLLSLAVLAITLVLVVVGADGTLSYAFNDMMVVDRFGAFMKVLVLIGSMAACIMSTPYLKLTGLAKFEYPVLILLATTGMMIMLSAATLLTLYVGLELQSLALYVLAAINRDRNRSTEAGLKYFVLGALSSGLLLYGTSLIYGFSGTLELEQVASIIEAGNVSLGMTVGLVFVLAGLAFKISAVPFHMWTPDVYEGAPTPVTAFFAAAPKVAAIGLLIRVLAEGFWDRQEDWQQIIVFMSIASMLVGAFIALVQTNIKRLMAYSSIGHIGFALMGLAAGSVDGLESVMTYMAVYLTMTLGSFGAVLAMRRDEGMVENIDDLAGLAKTNLPLAVAIGIFMLSLAGIPLLLGFWAKLAVFTAAIDAGLISLAVVGGLSSVVSAFYYLRIFKIMFFDDVEEPLSPIDGSGVRFVIGASALINSPLSYVFVLAPLAGAVSWAALGFGVN